LQRQKLLMVTPKSEAGALTVIKIDGKRV